VNARFRYEGRDLSPGAMPSRAGSGCDVGSNDGSARVGMLSRNGRALCMPTSADTFIGETDSIAAAKGMAPGARVAPPHQGVTR
jgi:hypothetical protein